MNTTPEQLACFLAAVTGRRIQRLEITCGGGTGISSTGISSISSSSTCAKLRAVPGQNGGPSAVEACAGATLPLCKPITSSEFASDDASQVSWDRAAGGPDLDRLRQPDHLPAIDLQNPSATDRELAAAR